MLCPASLPPSRLPTLARSIIQLKPPTDIMGFSLTPQPMSNGDPQRARRRRNPSTAAVRGRDALMIAAELDYPQLVDMLLAHGADASQRDKTGKQAKDLTTDAAVAALLSNDKSAHNPAR